MGETDSHVLGVSEQFDEPVFHTVTVSLGRLILAFHSETN